MFSKVALVATLGAALVSATSITIPNVSKSCSDALGNVLISPQAACLNAGSLVNLALDPSASIVSVVDSWAQGMCAVPACASSDLTAIVKNVTDGCLSDINTATATMALPALTADQVQAAVAQYYPTARNIACLKDNSANSLCVTQTLNNVQGLLGTLSINNAMADVQKALTLTSVPTNITCTDCIQAAYVQLRTAFPDQVSQYGLTTELNTICPSGFTSGTTPSTVSEVAVSTKKNGAMRASMAGGAVMAVGAVFAFLA